MLCCEGVIFGREPSFEKQNNIYVHEREYININNIWRGARQSRNKSGTRSWITKIENLP
jgi:hypothetical protein